MLAKCLAVFAVVIALSGCGAQLPNDLRKQQIEQQKQTNKLLRELIVIERRNAG